MQTNPTTVGLILQRLGNLIGRRGELVAAEAKLWAEASALLKSAADVDLTLPSSADVKSRDVSADGDGLLSVQRAAEFLGLAPATLAQWRLKGNGPEFVRLGRRIFYQRNSLDAFVSKRTYPHTSAYDRDQSLAPKKR